MATEAQVEAAARSLAVTVVSGSKDRSPDEPRLGDGEPRWKNWEHSARLALEAAQDRKPHQRELKMEDDGNAIDREYLSKALDAADFARMNAGTLSNRELAAIVEAAKRTLHMLTTLEQTVADEMVERGLRAFYKHTAVQNFPQVAKDQMREALLAAIGD